MIHHKVVFILIIGFLYIFIGLCGNIFSGKIIPLSSTPSLRWENTIQTIQSRPILHLLCNQLHRFHLRLRPQDQTEITVETPAEVYGDRFCRLLHSLNLKNVLPHSWIVICYSNMETAIMTAWWSGESVSVSRHSVVLHMRIRVHTNTQVHTL